MTKECPFCEEEGCCFCDHEGTVRIGFGQFFETVEDFETAVERVFVNRAKMMQGALDAIKRLRGENVPVKDYNIDHTINDW